MQTQALQLKENWEQHSYWEAVAGKVLRELPSREGYWLVGKGPVEPAGTEHLETGELGDDKQVGQVADTVGYMLAGTDQQGVAGKDWKEDKH